MKTSIIFFGLAVLSLTTAQAATKFNSLDLDQQEFATVTVANIQQSQSAFVNYEFSNTEVNNGTDAEVFNPNSVITSYVKSNEEVIAENKLVIDNQEAVPQYLSLDYTPEDRIAEGNQIIESTVSSEMAALDFEKINHAVKPVTIHTSAIKTTEIKL